MEETDTKNKFSSLENLVIDKLIFFQVLKISLLKSSEIINVENVILFMGIQGVVGGGAYKIIPSMSKYSGWEVYSMTTCSLTDHKN